VLNDFGPLGRETDEAEADEATIVENILSGQYSHPVRVIAFNTTEGWARDVTKDIAQAVLSKGADRTPLNPNRRAGVFSENAGRVDGVFGRLKSSPTKPAPNPGTAHSQERIALRGLCRLAAVQATCRLLQNGGPLTAETAIF
jgi:hypothetical protein